jgi:hypothetical protein
LGDFIRDICEGTSDHRCIFWRDIPAAQLKAHAVVLILARNFCERILKLGKI